MCKFTNRLFVFALCCSLGLQMVCVWAKPLHGSSRDDSDDLGALIALSALMNSQDIHYDQRQRGDENYRIKLDGFYIGLPQEDSSTLLLLTDDIFESIDDDYLSALGKNKPSAKASATSAPSSSASADSSSAASESHPNISSSSASNPANISPEITAPKKYLEARHGVNTGSRTKSYIAQFLKLLKRGRKH